MGPLEAALARLDRGSPIATILLALALVLACAGVDWVTGVDLSLSIAFVLPVSLAAWGVGRRAGLAIAAVSSALWTVVNLPVIAQYASPLIHYWNGVVRLGFLSLAAVFVSFVRTTVDREKQLARTDHLTGIANARAFAELAELELARARRTGRPFTLAYIDIDDFKAMNDRFGHPTGDTLLQTVAAALRTNVRTTDIAARLGGDEFGVLLAEIPLDAARAVVATLHRSVMRALEGAHPDASVSVGAVTFATPPDSLAQALGHETYPCMQSSSKARAASSTTSGGRADAGSAWQIAKCRLKRRERRAPALSTNLPSTICNLR